jgi:hypothetical protein
VSAVWRDRDWRSKLNLTPELFPGFFPAEFSRPFHNVSHLRSCSAHQLSVLFTGILSDKLPVMWLIRDKKIETSMWRKKKLRLVTCEFPALYRVADKSYIGLDTIYTQETKRFMQTPHLYPSPSPKSHLKQSTQSSIGIALGTELLLPPASSPSSSSSSSSSSPGRRRHPGKCHSESSIGSAESTLADPICLDFGRSQSSFRRFSRMTRILCVRMSTDQPSFSTVSKT